MGPIRNPRWEQKRTEGYVIVSNVDDVRFILDGGKYEAAGRDTGITSIVILT
jgi:hypothetical protein